MSCNANKQAELERIELLNRERKAREEAEKLNRIKDEFLATLSHELRTPLNAIIGWMQLIRNGNMGKAQISKALEVIDRSAKAQNQLIEDLLDVSRIIRGTMKLQLEPENLIDIIIASLDTVRPAAEAKKIQIKTQLESQIIEVKVDAERIQQVFWNLLINAVKFTPMNGSVTISTETRENTVLVRVTDTGQGIADDVLPMYSIALTAYAREEDKQQALEAGFDLHLPKPLEPFQLIESISGLIRQK
ncbi:MAG: hybrid sensor histidine kinase/response regulator [Xenococcaceae cyanobacterium MO_188.B32]|nr:hybrid sensor histidine kinase/response regulator [Xenococcaceae cyanobacterium MO_188.B32]